MPAAKHIHRNKTTLADIVDIGHTLESRIKKPKPIKIDNRPTVEQVAAIAKAANDTESVNAATIIYELAAASWSQEDDERFWSLLR